MSVKLHSSCIGRGPPVVLLHGLFGSGNNLGALARSLQDRYEVHSVELPNHGRSGWLHGADLRAMAACLREWMEHHGLRAARLAGHSLGGKVAMQFALDNPDRVGALVVADIAPVAYAPHHDAVFAALDAVAAARCPSREAAAELMADHLQELEVIQFLLTGLRREPDGSYVWRFNLEGIKESYASVLAAPESRSPYRGPVMFVRGGESDYIREQHRSPILGLFPAAEMKTMPGCGHWLHAQRPQLFNSVVGRFLDAHPS